MKSQAATVDAYLLELAGERRETVAALREVVRRSVPDAVEGMSYGMPSYDLRGLLCSIASQKAYFALYVCDLERVEAYAPQLGRVDVGKSCIRFRRLDQLSLPAAEALLRAAAAARRSAPG